MIKFACFECRKVFLKPEGPMKRDPKTQDLSWTPPLYSCPECGESIHFAGQAFRAPRRHAIDQWKKAELLILNGFLFHSHVGPYPKTLSAARQFVKGPRKEKKGWPW
jgi:hypothetical protein